MLWNKSIARKCGIKVKGKIMARVILAFYFAFVVTNAYEFRKTRSIDSASSPRNVCDTPVCIHTASSILNNMNNEVKPCENFYDFACGGFIKNKISPGDEKPVDIFSSVEEQLKLRLENIIAVRIKPDEPKAFRLLKTFYQSCINMSSIENQGFKPLLENLEKFGGWPVLMKENWNETNFDWTKSIYKLRKMGYSASYFINFTVDVDPKNELKRVINLDQATLGLSREYLSRGISDKIVKAYYDYMVDIAVILGANKTDAKEQLKQSLEFEIKLANISLPSKKRRNLYNPMTIDDMIHEFPSIPWAEYLRVFSTYGAKVTTNECAVVKVLRFVKRLENLLERTPKRVLANYIGWRTVFDSAIYLNNVVRKRHLVYLTASVGQKNYQPRWKECVDTASTKLPVSAGALYVKNYFNKYAKTSVLDVMANITKEFTKVLREADWLYEYTQEVAVEKLETMTTRIAYPDELLDDNKLDDYYKNLELSPDNYLGNALNVSLFVAGYVYRQKQNSAVVKTKYDLDFNSLEVSAGILQDAFFDKDRPRYMNYGSIGFLMGREITFGFDNNGCQYDRDGNPIRWWMDETIEKYAEIVKCFVHQYGNYTDKEVDLKLNGLMTQRENVADNVGVKIAYRAFNELINRSGEEPKLPALNYTNRQMFWISFANTLCTKYRPENLKNHITTQAQSPSKFRVTGPISNMPEFAKDFQCLADSKMNPKDKCKIW